MPALHVRQLASYVRQRYESTYAIPDLDEVNNLSRFLALYALETSLGASFDDPLTIVEITDSGQDRGIDAIGVDTTSGLVVAVQSKWSQDGTGSADLAGTLKFLDGIRALLDMPNSGATHMSPTTHTAVRNALNTPGAFIRLVFATTGSGALADGVERPVRELVASINGDSAKISEFLYLDQNYFYTAMSAPLQAPAVDLDITLLDWGKVDGPVRGYYGSVNAAEIAQWAATHGTHLFRDNIRVALTRSDINGAIQSTAVSQPELFWFYNNGITLLADRVDQSPTGSLSRDVAHLKAIAASVVNGAQTVSSLGRAYDDGHARELSTAKVMVRVIEVAGGDTDLSRDITQYTNTQNDVSSQDFGFLDDEQHRLVAEIGNEGYEYILRPGQAANTQDLSKVIDLRPAAVALACAREEVRFCAIAKREVSRIFDIQANYKTLFNPSTDGLFIIRCVLFVRAVDYELYEQEAAAGSGTRAGIARSGNRLIAHILLKGVGRKSLADPDFDFEAVLSNVPGMTRDALDKLEANFPSNSYPGNLFKSISRMEALKLASGY